MLLFSEYAALNLRTKRSESGLKRTQIRNIAVIDLSHCWFWCQNNQIRELLSLQSSWMVSTLKDAFASACVRVSHPDSQLTEAGSAAMMRDALFQPAARWGKLESQRADILITKVKALFLFFLCILRRRRRGCRDERGRSDALCASLRLCVHQLRQRWRIRHFRVVAAHF